MKNLSFLTLDEVASILKVTKMTIYRYIKRGELKAYQFGKEYRVQTPDFEDFLKKALVRAEKSIKTHSSCIGVVKNKK